MVNACTMMGGVPAHPRSHATDLIESAESARIGFAERLHRPRRSTACTGKGPKGKGSGRALAELIAVSFLLDPLPQRASLA